MGDAKDSEEELEVFRMKVSRNVSIEVGLMVKVLKLERNFSKAVTEALEDWLTKKREECTEECTEEKHVRNLETG